MRHSILSLMLALFFLAPARMAAQDKSELSYTFVYIAYDNSMSNVERKLESELKEIYNRAILNSGPTIFYLANGKEPIIVRINFGDDNRNEFDDELVAKLQESNGLMHNSSYDLGKIMEIFNAYDFLDANGNLAYRRTDFYFFIGEDFIHQDMYDNFLGALYFQTDLMSFLNTPSFNTHVLCPREVKYSTSDLGRLMSDEFRNRVRIRQY